MRKIKKKRNNTIYNNKEIILDHKKQFSTSLINSVAYFILNSSRTFSKISI